MLKETSSSLQLDAIQLNAVYDAFFKYSGHAIAILDPIEDGNDFVFVDANTGEGRFANRPREEIINRRLTDAYPNLAGSGLLQLIRKVWKEHQTLHFDPIFYHDHRIHIWVKGYICKLPGDGVMVVLKDVTSEIRRHRQQELELTILSELRNTDQLSQVIPDILTQIKGYIDASHVCLYLLPEFQTEEATTAKNCIWTYCDDETCESDIPCEKCGDLHCPHRKVLTDSGDPEYRFFTRDGSFWFMDLEKLHLTPEFMKVCAGDPVPAGPIKSGCIVALRSGDEILGILQVISEQAYNMDEKQVEFMEVIGASIGMALGHQHAERQLRMNEKKMRTILNTMPAMLDAFDEEGNIIYWNKECERVTGYTTEEAINNPNMISLLYPDPKYRQLAIDNLRKNTKDFKNAEFILTDKNGALRTISWSNISNSMPVPGWHAWAIGQDVTHRNKTEQVLQGVLKGTARESGTLFFRNLAKNLARTLGVKFCMICEMLPHQPGCCGTRAVWAGDDFADNFIYQIEGTPCSQVARNTFCIVKHNVARLFPKDHLLVEMGVDSYAGIRLLDAEENTLGILAILDDKPLHETELINSVLPIFSARAASELERQHAVEEQQRLEAQLRQSQKMEAVGQLAGGIAHDFNNLLQAISGYTELATYSLDPSHSACSDLKEVSHAANRARDLVQQLLSFSSRQVLHPKVLNVNQVVNGTYKMIRRVIGEQIDFEFSQSENIQPILADQGQLDQIIINLCVNARDAMPNGGKLSIKTFPFTASERYCHTHNVALPGQYTCISVSDTGVGMSSDLKEHIFEPFFSTKGLGKGTGLGLSTVFGIVAQHKGFINVESTPSSGTTFEIFMPVSAPEKDAESEPLKQNALGIKGKGETILLAEDEEVVRNLGSTILEKAGYTVIAASDGKKAIDLFQQHQDEISFAVLDVIMPHRSGPDVYKVIREKRPELPVLFATGYSFNLLENEIPHNGCEIISKPFSPHQLLKTISDMLEADSSN